MLDQNPQLKTPWQRLKSIVIGFFMLLLAILVVALVVESLLKYQDEQQFPAPGQLYDVNGHQMHIWCAGDGEPAVVLDAGASMFSTGWRWVMPELSAFTRVCAFDRSGLGWSDSAPPPYDGVSAANELHVLLDQAGIKKPFVYVGHSLGANLGGIYHYHYPDDLSALVMLEPAPAEIFLQEMQEDRGTAIVRGTPVTDCGMSCVMVSLASSLGLVDIALEQTDVINDPLFHQQALAEFKARTNRRETLEFILTRGKYIFEIMFESEDSDDFGKLPIAIFHSENAGELLGDSANEKELLEDREKAVNAYKEMLKLSARPLGLFQISNANHLTMVMYQQPAKEVADYILDILVSVRDRQIASNAGSDVVPE